MKKRFILLLALCLCLLCTTAAAEGAPQGLSYEARELSMPAAGVMVYVPADMDGVEGDEEAYDLGFRFDCFNDADTFDCTLYVNDSRDMSLADYAAFYAGRSGYAAYAAETVNGYTVMRLTGADNPNDFTVLIAGTDTDAPSAVYSLSFGCSGEADAALANEILNTLTEY